MDTLTTLIHQLSTSDLRSVDSSLKQGREGAKSDIFAPLFNGLVEDGRVGSGEELPSGGNALPPELLAALQAELLAGEGELPAELTEHGIDSETLLSMPLELTALLRSERGQEILATKLSAAMPAPVATAIERMMQEFLQATALPGELDGAEDGEQPRLPSTHPEGALLRIDSGAAATSQAARLSTLSPAVPTLQAHPQSPQFAGELGEAILRFAKNGTEEAKLRLNPPELGPLNLSVRVNGDTISLHMNASHSVTREALEMALPRLREMFAEMGLQLGDANVGDSGDPGPQQGGHEAMMGTSEQADESETTISTVQLQKGKGLIDLYA